MNIVAFCAHTGTLGWTKQLVEALVSSTPEDVQIHVWDNASKERIVDVLQSYSPRVVVYRSESNLDDPRGINEVLKRVAHIDYNLFIKVDTDSLLRGSWYSDTLAAMDASPRIGCAGHVWLSGDMMGCKTIMDEHANLMNREWLSRNIYRWKRGIEHVQGGFMVLRKAALKNIGGFHPDIPHGGCDVEISLRLVSWGWDIVSLPFVMCIHPMEITRGNALKQSLSVVHPVRSDELRTLFLSGGANGQNKPKYSRLELPSIA